MLAGATESDAKMGREAAEPSRGTSTEGYTFLASQRRSHTYRFGGLPNDNLRYLFHSTKFSL